MPLPDAEQAIVPPEKARDYLLSPDHRIGRSKARFFGALGFTQDAWPRLRGARLALECTAEPGGTTIFGKKYTVRGIVQGPAGRSAMVVSAWIALRGEDVPRSATACPTAYPAESLR